MCVAAEPAQLSPPLSSFSLTSTAASAAATTAAAETGVAIGSRAAPPWVPRWPQCASQIDHSLQQTVAVLLRGVPLVRVCRLSGRARRLDYAQENVATAETMHLRADGFFQSRLTSSGLTLLCPRVGNCSSSLGEPASLRHLGPRWPCTCCASVGSQSAGFPAAHSAPDSCCRLELHMYTHHRCCCSLNTRRGHDGA